MSGLAPLNLRHSAPDVEVAPPEIIIDIAEDGGDVPEIDAKGNILKIEHGDGSITVSLDGSPLESAGGNDDGDDWFANLAEKIDEAELNRISDDLLRGIEDDLTSRKTWIENRAQGIKLLGLTIEVPNVGGGADGAPVEGMSKVRHPLLLEAVLRFQANARSELLPTDGPVKVRNDSNNDTTDQDELAHAYERDLNHYLTSTATEYYPDTDRMLLMLGFGGTAFKKVYFCPLRNRPVSETVDADDLIVNNEATDLANARRVTHRSMMLPSTVKRMQILGAYRDVDLSQALAPKEDALKRAENDQQGITVSTMNPLDRNREIYECYCELEIKGYEYKFKGKDTGLEVPYRVTIDVSSQKILSVVRNYSDDPERLPETKKVFVKYVYIPGMGFYDIGLLHILGNTTNAITAAWRELLDAGMYSNFPGFLLSDTGARQNTNIFRIPPGGAALVKTGGAPLRDAVMPLPYQPPNQALMSLVGDIATTGMRIGGTSEQQVGEGRADAPVGTTIAMIEQATKVENAVHKRIHAAQAEEFQLLAECFAEHPESFWQRNKKPTRAWDQATFAKALADYDLVPQADPNTASHGQRVMKITALKQLQAQNPAQYDAMAVDKVALQTIGWNNPDQFLIPLEKQQPSPEAQAAMAKTANDSKRADAEMIGAQAKAAETGVKIQTGAFAPKQEGLGAAQAPPPMSQAEMLELQVRQAEVAQDQRHSVLESVNRMRDRESKERIAAMDYAEEMAKLTPEQRRIADGIVDPSMLQRLEDDEPPLPGGQP